FDSVSIPGNGVYTGHKRALLIGIRSCKSDGYEDLDMAHDDVYKMRDLLIEVYHYTEAEIIILLDDGIHIQPTRQNILAAIAEFVKNVKGGDRLCFHYSGHSTQLKNPHSRRCSEEDGLDECLVPLDGENMKIIDNELHAALVQPLPFGSHLVAVLDTCNSGSLLDLKHHRCNSVYVPWDWRGRRDSKSVRNGVVSLPQQFSLPQHFSLPQPSLPPLSLPQLLRRWLGPHPPTHNTASKPHQQSESNDIRDPPTSAALSRSLASRSSSIATNNSGHSRLRRTSTTSSNLSSPLTRLRPKGKLTLAHLYSLSKSRHYSSSALAKVTDKEAPAAPVPQSILYEEGDEAKRCESPVQGFYCPGWCQNVVDRSTLLDEDDKVKADVICLASPQKAWQGEGVSMTSALAELLRENPQRSLQDILIQLSYKTYSPALSRRSRSREYNAQRKTYDSFLVRQIKRLESGNQSTASLVTPDKPGIIVPPTPHSVASGSGLKKPALLRTVGEQIQTLKQRLRSVRHDKWYDMDDFQTLELSSQRPLDMNRAWSM
ncbi:Metacaspase type II, partial [Favolaschia claudopus]